MATCVNCGAECEGTSGYSRDDGTLAPLCHEGPSPTCYERHSIAHGAGAMRIVIQPEDMPAFREFMRRAAADV